MQSITRKVAKRHDIPMELKVLKSLASTPLELYVLEQLTAVMPDGIGPEALLTISLIPIAPSKWTLKATLTGGPTSAGFIVTPRK